MAAPKGNEFWRNRMDMSKDGRKLSLEDFATKVSEYIQRCVEDSIFETDFRGKEIQEVLIPKRIAMTMWGVCVHCGIDASTWQDWRKKEKYSAIITRAESIFKSWNIEGSAAGQLNPNIIARLEGLKEQVDNTSSDGSAKQLITLQYQGKDINLSD